MKIVISSGHGKKIRGAAGSPVPPYLDEVDEARKVVERTATALRSLGVETTTYHDDVSTTQGDNLNRIVNFHNSKTRDFNVSVHFNAYETTATKPMGSEVLYVSQEKLAKTVVDAICKAAPLINRGPKKRTDLKFLNATEAPSILIETCFVDSKPDAEIYRSHFDDISIAIAEAISGKQAAPGPKPQPPKSTGAAFKAKGPCSHFGGPEDTGVSPSEGLAFISDLDQAPHLFLPYQPTGTTGLARRLNPFVHYVACRWDYEKTPKDELREGIALVRAKGIELKAFPADWGPHEDTGRIADLSPSLMDDLGLTTDDEVEVIYPYSDAQA